MGMRARGACCQDWPTCARLWCAWRGQRRSGLGLGTYYAPPPCIQSVGCGVCMVCFVQEHPTPLIWSGGWGRGEGRCELMPRPWSKRWVLALVELRCRVAACMLPPIFYAEFIHSLDNACLQLDFLDFFVVAVDEWGPWGYAAYAGVYTALEVLAVPAIPLTMTAGATARQSTAAIIEAMGRPHRRRPSRCPPQSYGVVCCCMCVLSPYGACSLVCPAGVVFGPVVGTVVTSISGTVAATIAFLIARYAARDKVLAFAKRSKRFAAIDKAIGKDGFKFVTLLRLSPLLPLAASNYLYGLTAVELGPYMAGSFVGMLPGTYAYVSAGHVGKAVLTEGEGSLSPEVCVVCVVFIPVFAWLDVARRILGGAQPHCHAVCCALPLRLSATRMYRAFLRTYIMDILLTMLPCFCSSLTALASRPGPWCHGPGTGICGQACKASAGGGRRGGRWRQECCAVLAGFKA
eukprot:365542-Chlamydomonas_euryale.AAC.16